MDSSKRQMVLVGVMVVLLVVAAVVFMKPGKNAKVPPDNSSYYTGPMRNKAHPDTFTTDDGRIVPPPPGTPAKDPNPTPAGTFKD